MTRRHVPDGYIHPEHQKEYLVGELTEKVERAGFRIETVKGICPVPESVRTGVFDLDEIVRNAGVSGDPEVSYSFYVQAIKPGR